MPMPLILAAGLLLSGCAAYHTEGRFINLETGAEVVVAAEESRDGRILLEGPRAGGDTVRGELWEVRASDAPAGSGEPPIHLPGDTAYHGTGFLRGGDWVLEFDYRRLKQSSTALGSATDNRGGRYKAVFQRVRKPQDPKPSGP